MSELPDLRVPLSSSLVCCPVCSGTGEIRGPERGMSWYPCKLCDGSGAVTEDAAKDWHLRVGEP